MRKKLLVFIISTLFLAVFITTFLDKNSTYSVNAYSESKYQYSGLNESGYEQYLTDNEEIYPQTEITIDATIGYSFSNSFNDEVAYVTAVDDVSGLYVPETVDVSWSIVVPEAGYYNIKVDYFSVEGRSSEISRGFKVDGVHPFIEAKSFVLTRIWEDAFNVAEFREDGKHDIKPAQIEKARWNTESIRDTAGYFAGKAYYFYFSASEHTVQFVGDREPVVIKSITLYQETVDLSYQETLETYAQLGYQTISGIAFGNEGYSVVQGENAFEKSSPILAPVPNWSSYKIDPYVNFITRYNTVGGQTWRVPGDWISWEIDVPQSGLYELTFKVNQNYNRGMHSSRILYINGKVPFSECRSLQFEYKSDWQNVTLGNEDGSYLFYFEAGTNVITMEATIGIYADMVDNTEKTITILSTLYRKVVMIAGTNPDQYQDYMLEQRIDGLYDMIDECIANLELAIADIIAIAGARSYLSSSFEKTLYQMEKFKKSEKNIQIGLADLDDNISALGVWVMTISEQSLAIDKIYVHAEETPLPKATTNVFQKLWHEIVLLFGSYGANTSLESSVLAEGPTITVWISSGRDQSQLLRQMIDESFTMQQGVNVELKLVSETALLPATLSGNGPDVALGVLQNIPVNWGIRKALVDLTTFPDYEEVSGWFDQSAITPFIFDDAVYALPDTQDFLVSFIRTDIASELGLIAPKTWQEVVDILPTLQRQYLDYYLPNTKGGLSTLLYAMIVQNGGQLYSEDGSKTLLTEKNASQAFIDFTTFFGDYGFEISAVFSNRFRSGEMPMGIYNYSLYNTLSVFAPEIRGQWEFAELPGYVDSEGLIHSESTSTATGAIILADSSEIDASWQFVKWWLGEEAQTGYGRGLEAILGAAARYPTANLEAFKNLPWSTKDYLLLSTQRMNSVGVPTVPGDYIIGRYIDNAFRTTINNNTNPRENLFEYAEKINIELARKRQEFNLD